MCSNASFIEFVCQNVLPGWLHVTRQDTPPFSVGWGSFPLILLSKYIFFFMGCSCRYVEACF